MEVSYQAKRVEKHISSKANDNFHYNGVFNSLSRVNRLYNKSLKAVFQLHVFYTYVHARISLNHFNITFEVNK